MNSFKIKIACALIIAMFLKVFAHGTITIVMHLYLISLKTKEIVSHGDGASHWAAPPKIKPCSGTSLYKIPALQFSSYYAHLPINNQFYRDIVR